MQTTFVILSIIAGAVAALASHCVSLITGSIRRKKEGCRYTEELSAIMQKIPLGRMGCNYPYGYNEGYQTLYGDVMDWLRDNGYGKDHDLAVRIIGQHAVDKRWKGIPDMQAAIGGRAGSETGCRLLVIPQGGQRIDVITVNSTYLQNQHGGNVEDLVRSAYPHEPDHWMTIPPEGLSCSLFRITEQETPPGEKPGN